MATRAQSAPHLEYRLLLRSVLVAAENQEDIWRPSCHLLHYYNYTRSRASRQPPSPLQLSRLLSEHVHVQRVTGRRKEGGGGQIGPPLDAVAAAGQLRGGRGGEEGDAGGRARERLISTAGGREHTAEALHEGQARETAVIRSAGWHRLGGGAVRVGHDACSVLCTRPMEE